MNRLTADTQCHLHYGDCCIKGQREGALFFFFCNASQGFWSSLKKEITRFKSELVTHVIESDLLR